MRVAASLRVSDKLSHLTHLVTPGYTWAYLAIPGHTRPYLAFCGVHDILQCDLTICMYASQYLAHSTYLTLL